MENISVGMNSKAIYKQEHKELGNCEAQIVNWEQNLLAFH
jgi:hypothetical protein